MNKYTITALLANKSGVLTRLSGLFARRGFNIDSISACATEDANFSRVTIVFTGDEYTLSQMTKQLDKLIDVKKITLADEKDSVLRELLLVKVPASADVRSQIVEIKEIYKAKVVDLSPDTMILELTGIPTKLDAFLKVIEPYGIIEMQRTGVTVLARGRHTLKDRDCYGDNI